MIEAGVGIGILPASAAQRHARTMAIVAIALSDTWAVRAQQICGRSFEQLPGFAREMVEMLVADARQHAGGV